MPNPNETSEHECKACHDTGYRPFSNRLCSCVAGTLRVLGDKVIAPLDHPALLNQCTATESGGVQCEVFLSSPDEEHHHFISDSTIERHLRGGGY